jgi:diguanylate cyclase (GGDEF)-like protein/PAS domain S-box-containing protein
MSTLFQGQLDYICFFYGLAFIGLGICAYLLSKEAHQRLVWGWLALFGFIYGLTKWLDLLALSWEDGYWFAACRWGCVTLSLLFLVEFGHASLVRRRGSGPGHWVLGILALGAGLGALAGWTGLQVTTRYALGLVGGLWAGWVLCAESGLVDSRQRFWLMGAGVGLMFYGVANGLVGPQAEFFPASLINSETFKSLTSLPIQLVRGLLAIWIAIMVMGYCQVSWPATYRDNRRRRDRYFFSVSVALVIILVLGWVLTQHLGNLAREQIRSESLGHSKLIIQRLIFELEGAEAAAKAMSESPLISPALWSKSPQTIAQANSVLDRYHLRFGASPAYLMDPAGLTIASSNRNEPDNFVGHNFSFRPYFQQAMAGQLGCYFALGAISGKRGFFASYPVRDPAGKIVGAAIIKTTLDKFQHELQASDPAFLIDPRGVIFLASRPSLDNHSLWPMQEAEKAALKTPGPTNAESVFSQPWTDGVTVQFDGKNFLFHRQFITPFEVPGWSLVLLAPAKKVVFFRLLGIATTFILVVLLLIYVGTNLSIREGANRIIVSESRFRAMFDAAPEAVFVLDSENRQIVDANPFMAQWLGYGLDELIGLKIDQIRGPGGLGPHEEAARPGPEDSNLAPGPLYRKKDGTLVDVECTTANILHGDHIREIVFVRDITARKKVAADLVWEAMVNSAIADLSRSLLASLPLENIGAITREYAVNLTGSTLAICGYINPTTGKLVGGVMTEEAQRACQVEDHPTEFHNFGGLWVWVQENGKPLLTNQPHQDPRFTGIPSGHLPIHRFLSVPAMIEGKLVGQIVLANADRDYTARDQEVCERLALLYAQAIHRQRLDETLRESETSLQTILDHVQTGVLLIDPASHIIVDANPIAVKMIGLPKERIVGCVCHQFVCPNEVGKCPITDLEDTVNNAERILLRAGGESRWIIKTVVPVPLKGKEYLLESFVDITERRQSEEALQTANDKLQALVAQVEDRNRTMTLANEMADILQACQASEEAYGAVAHFMPRFFPEDRGALYMLNNSRNLFEAVATWGDPPPGASVFAPEDCWSVRRGRPHKVNHPRDALICRHVAPASAGGYLCVPMIAQGETLGVLHIDLEPQPATHEPGVSVTKEQLALALGEDMALALANLKLRETLRSQAIRDPLTGLFNRRYMEETLERELKRSKRTGSSLAVIMMDLDHFKQYNDTFGHNAGDELLSALGSLFKSQIREEDIACRYGGEEFLLIIPSATKEVALERAELFRQAVRQMHKHHRNVKSITLSLGLAVYPDHGASSLELIRAADVALYQAKRAGRDRVVAARDAGDVKPAHLLALRPFPPASN